MRLTKNKKGVNVASISTGVILLIVTVIIVFRIVGSTAGDITSAATNISNADLPLASLFQSDGDLAAISC